MLGGGGAGRTSALRALAMTAARNGAAVTGLDGGGSLARLDGATVGTDPQVSLGAIVPVRDDERMARLLWWLETDPAMTPRVLIIDGWAVSYTHLRAHETVLDLVCRLLLEKKNTSNLCNVTSAIHCSTRSDAKNHTQIK